MHSARRKEDAQRFDDCSILREALHQHAAHAFGRACTITDAPRCNRLSSTANGVHANATAR